MQKWFEDQMRASDTADDRSSSRTERDQHGSRFRVVDIARFRAKHLC